MLSDHSNKLKMRKKKTSQCFQKHCDNINETALLAQYWLIFLASSRWLKMDRTLDTYHSSEVEI